MRPLDELGQTVEKWWDTINLRDQFELLFRSALEEQTKPDRGRAALIDYSEGGEGSPKIFTSHLDLKNQLNGIQDILFGHAKGRYLIILEDLSRNWVELLGPALRIPISVFALHMASPEDHILGRARVPLGESPGRHFVLSYQQPTKLEIAPKSKDKVYRIDCAANRLINTKIKVDRMTGPETAEQLVSYWGRQSLASDANTVGSSYESWIAIMLVDPCPTRDLGLKKSAPSPVPQKDEEDEDDDEDNDVNGPTLITRRYQHPPRLSRLNKAPNVGVVNEDRWSRDDHDKISKVGPRSSRNENPGIWPKITRFNSPESFFDELLEPDCVHITKLPSSSTYRCRRLVLAKAVAVVNNAMMETLNLTKQAASGVQDISQFNFDKFDDRSWSDEWRGKFFTDLWELREDLELMGLKFRQNKKVIARVAKLAKNKESGQQSQDLLEWENVLDTKDYAFQIMARTTDSYLQTVSATGAQFANLQSRSINRLTGLASLFFPASLCAAVLAIPSFSHAGEATKFWYGIISSSIFWVFSVPVSIILALLLISPFPARLRKQFAKRREKKARENRMRRVKEADENRRRRVPSRENELADRKLAQKKMGSAPADPANMV